MPLFVAPQTQIVESYGFSCYLALIFMSQRLLDATKDDHDDDDH